MVNIISRRAAAIGSSGGSTPPPASGFGEVNRVGASVNYENHVSHYASAHGGGGFEPPIGSFQDQYEANFRHYDDQIRIALGLPSGTKVLAGPHRYQSSVPNTWNNIELRWAYPDYNWGLQNMQISSGTNGAGWTNVANGSLNGTVSALIASVPEDFTLICGFAHEPENNGSIFPDQDGGTWEETYGPPWSRMQAALAELFVQANRPNVWMMVCHMGDTFPLSTGAPGGLGNRGKDAQNWNAWQYMSAAAKARTIFGPDIYTKMNDDLGTSSSYTKLATRHGNIVNYVTASGWGVQRIGISEHTVNNDVEATAVHRAAAIENDMRVYLRGLKNAGKLAYYAHFCTSDTDGASGNHGWFDRTAEYEAFGALVREINVGGGGPSGTSGVAFVAAATNTANTATPSLTKPAAAANGDYAIIQFTCRDTVTLTDPAGWTVLVSEASVGGGRYRVYGKFLDGSETSTNVVPSMGATVSRWVAEMLVYSGVHATPINGTPGVATSTTTNTVQTTGTTTTSVADCTIVSLASHRSGTVIVTSYTPPAGYTGRAQAAQTTSAGATAAAADKANQPIGTYGADQWTTDAAVGSFVGVTLALRPA